MNNVNLVVYRKYTLNSHEFSFKNKGAKIKFFISAVTPPFTLAPLLFLTLSQCAKNKAYQGFL